MVFWPLFWRLFWDGEGRRLRAGVRVLLHLLALAIALLILSAIPAPSWVLGPIAFATVLAITFAFARLVDRRRLVDLGLRVDRSRLVDLASGMIVGAGCIGLVASCESALGVCDYAMLPMNTLRAVRIAYVAVFFVGVAVQEELVFRGYQLVNLTEGLTTTRMPPRRAAVLAAIASASAFGLAHAGNDGASIVATLQVAVAGGSLLAVGFVLTGDLAFSIGLHFAWNFAQCLLGMPVSGFALGEAAALTRLPHGSEMLTGGTFGPEASLIGLFAMWIGTGASVLYVRVRYGALTMRLRVGMMPRQLPTSSEPPSGAS